MELIAVSGPAPDDVLSPEYLAWHEAEFNARGSLVIRQSAQIQALQSHVNALEGQLTGVLDTCRGLVKPSSLLKIVEDAHDGDLPDADPPLEGDELDAVDPPLPDPDPGTTELEPSEVP